MRKFDDGERLPLLLNADGVPHWDATLFVTIKARNANKAPNTSAAILSAIRVLFTWAEQQNVDLHARFRRCHFLSENELESLRRFSLSGSEISSVDSARRSRSSRRWAANSKARIDIEFPRVSSNTAYIRLTYIAEYLYWLGIQTIEERSNSVAPNALEALVKMRTIINGIRPKTRHGSRLKSRQGLPPKAQEQLLLCVTPSHPANPFAVGTQHRNQLIVQLLFHLGLRGGELLALKVGDFDLQQNTVVVERRHGDASDPRTAQPVVKTLDRRVPLSQNLADLVSQYVMNHRRLHKAAKRHPFLLVTHRPGPFQGEPLSLVGLSKQFKKLQNADAFDFTGLSAHVLRHTANDRFSALMDSLGVPESKEEKMRSYLMGWREGSGSAAVYTRRHTAKKAEEAALTLQKGWEGLGQ